MAGELILPGDPAFGDMYGQFFAGRPPSVEDVANKDGETYHFVVRPGTAENLAVPVTESELDDYFQSGEYDARLEEMEASQPEEPELETVETMKELEGLLQCLHGLKTH